MCMCVCVYGGSQRVCIATPNHCVFRRTRSLVSTPCLMHAYATCIHIQIYTYLCIHKYVYIYVCVGGWVGGWVMVARGSDREG